MENPCVFLGIKVKPGPIERHRVENFALDNTVENLKTEAEKKTNIPSDSLELIHHGKILKGDLTLQDSGVKNGEMIHVVKKKVPVPTPPPPQFTDSELQQLNSSLRTLGCTPNAPGWTRAMQLLNDESAMEEILEQAPSLNDDCVTLSILHEVELLAALGANIQTMRRGATAYPDLPNAVRQLTRLVRSRSTSGNANDNVPTSGFAYSLEALSEDEEADDEDNEETERNPITQEQLAAALQAATEAVRGGAGAAAAAAGASAAGGSGGLLRLLRGPTAASGTTAGGAGRSGAITAEMFSEAISEAIGRAAPSAAAASSTAPAPMSMDHSAAGSSSASPPATPELQFASQLTRMREMGLVDDSVNVRALLICSGDVNAAINLVLGGAITDN